MDEQSPPTSNDEQSPPTPTASDVGDPASDVGGSVSGDRIRIARFSASYIGDTSMASSLPNVRDVLGASYIGDTSMASSLPNVRDVLGATITHLTDLRRAIEGLPFDAILHQDALKAEPTIVSHLGELLESVEAGDAVVVGDDEFVEVTNQSSTSLTLNCSAISNLSSFFKKAQREKPGVKELSLIGVSFFQPYHVSVETKNETLEILKIRAERGSVHQVFHAVAQNCPALTELDITFAVKNYPIETAHRGSSTSSICHSLRVLNLTMGQFTLKDLTSVMDVVSALYPNIQHLTINVKDQYQSDEKSIIGSVSLQLHHLEDLKFSSTGMDPKAEKGLQSTVHEFSPQLAPASSQDGVYFFRRIYGVSGYLDHLGGELSIPAHEVKLSIPPGALENREKISFEVFTDLPNGINLQDNEIAASFGFRCFPSGSSFKKPFTISMPHCAVLDDNEVVGMVLHFGSNDEGDIRRIPLETNRYVIHTDSFELQLDHFSWGVLTMIYNRLYPGGNPESQATKRMLCTPFIPKTISENQDLLILHVRFYNKLPGLAQKILAEEESLKYKKIYPDQELIVKEDSIDMSISCQSKELPIKQTKVMTKDLMQHPNITECMELLQQMSLVTLIITQERKITMKFWTVLEGFPSLEKPQHGLGIMPLEKDALFDELSKKIPTGKYTMFCNKMGVDYNEAKSMLTKCKEDYNVALRDLLSQWDLRIKGVTRKQLEDALVGADVGGLCSIVEKYYEKASTEVVAATSVVAGDGAVNDTRNQFINQSDRSTSVHTNQGVPSSSVGETDGNTLPRRSLVLNEPTLTGVGFMASNPFRAFIYLPRSLTNGQLWDISGKLPKDQFNSISMRLGFDSAETENIRCSSTHPPTFYFAMLTKWLQKTGAAKVQLVRVLEEFGLCHIVESLKLEPDDNIEDLD